MTGGVDSASESLWREEQEDGVVSVVVLKGRKVKGPAGLHHLQENHDWCMERYGRCVYCDNGSIIMSREEINKGIEY